LPYYLGHVLIGQAVVQTLRNRLTGWVGWSEPARKVLGRGRTLSGSGHAVERALNQRVFK
jgi:hypothetical protein